MPNTRKKVIKTVYKDEDDSEIENAGDFSDSGSEAYISEQISSDEDENEDCDISSGDEFIRKSKNKTIKNPKSVKKTTFSKNFINKVKNQLPHRCEDDDVDTSPALFSVNDLTDADKLLPPILNLSESDSSEDESIKPPSKKNLTVMASSEEHMKSDSDNESAYKYKDVWSNNLHDNSEEIAKRTFLELEQHKSKVDETKSSVQKYIIEKDNQRESNVQDLLAQGEGAPTANLDNKEFLLSRNAREYSDSDIEDWEEVKEAKAIPQQGLQLIVNLPDTICRKSKKMDVEMMMKRKINRVKKENQVYMHKVHVLCWLGHGNYISHVLNDQDLLTAALSLLPSKECYPGERVDIKYVEQITKWYKDKMTLKQNKNENKFKPKAPPLKISLLKQIQSKVVTTKKYMVFIFIIMLRALGLQCRVMFNFITLPIKPPSSELCSLSTKAKDDKRSLTLSGKEVKINKNSNQRKKTNVSKSKTKQKIPQMDGNADVLFCIDNDYENIMQVDGNNDDQTRSTRSTRSKRHNTNNVKTNEIEEDVSLPKRSRNVPSSKSAKATISTIENKKKQTGTTIVQKITKTNRKNQDHDIDAKSDVDVQNDSSSKKTAPLSRRQKNLDNKVILNERRTDNLNKSTLQAAKKNDVKSTTENVNNLEPKVLVTNQKNKGSVSSTYFEYEKSTDGTKNLSLSKKRSRTATSPSSSQIKNDANDKGNVTKTRTKSAPGSVVEKSKYFKGKKIGANLKSNLSTQKSNEMDIDADDKQRVSHKDLVAKTKMKPQIDVTPDLVHIIKNRVKSAKLESKEGIVKGKIKDDSDEDSDYLPEDVPKHRNSDSEEDFKPVKISPKPSTSRKLDRRVLSSDDETSRNKTDVWCEVFVEELEQWIAVDVIKGQVHCTREIYGRLTHPVAYIVGWDNNNYLKDLTRKYVPQWNTVTRKQRADPAWWDRAVRPWLGPKTPQDRQEDEYLDKMQLEAPLPKSIAEYKNHPLYALKRHLLKFEALYPADAATLGFVRGEPVYARECVHTCRSRDTWLKEAKVVRLGEKPYKVVKARPKWDKLSNKLITDKPLEVFGPWQVQDYEPPVAENGIVPRNAYGNVELFKACMLPKGTVHIKLPGLNKVAKKLNIDCAPAMTGFDFNGGWSHPVYDGFVVCKEFEEIVTEAWVEDQEEQERKEREKADARVYGNWRRLIKGLLIRERLKSKYGFEDPSSSHDNKKKSKGPRLVVKKKT